MWKCGGGGGGGVYVCLGVCECECSIVSWELNDYGESIGRYEMRPRLLRSVDICAGRADWEDCGRFLCLQLLGVAYNRVSEQISRLSESGRIRKRFDISAG